MLLDQRRVLQPIVSALMILNHFSHLMSSGTRYVFDQLLKEHGIKIEPYMELGSSEALKQAVLAGVLSLHSVQLEPDVNKLTLHDVEGFPLKRLWYVIHLKGRKLSLVARTFLDYILKESHKSARSGIS